MEPRRKNYGLKSEMFCVFNNFLKNYSENMYNNLNY